MATIYEPHGESLESYIYFYKHRFESGLTKYFELKVMVDSTPDLKRKSQLKILLFDQSKENRQNDILLQNYIRIKNNIPRKKRKYAFNGKNNKALF